MTALRCGLVIIWASCFQVKCDVRSGSGIRAEEQAAGRRCVEHARCRAPRSNFVRVCACERHFVKARRRRKGAKLGAQQPRGRQNGGKIERPEHGYCFSISSLVRARAVRTLEVGDARVGRTEARFIMHVIRQPPPARRQLGVRTVHKLLGPTTSSDEFSTFAPFQLQPDQQKAIFPCARRRELSLGQWKQRAEGSAGEWGAARAPAYKPGSFRV